MKKIYIDGHSAEQTRIVTVDEVGRVEAIACCLNTQKKERGNIYAVKVSKIEPSIGAAFVDYGGSSHGFYSLKNGESAPKKGELLLLQVEKDGRFRKGLVFTDKISITGKYSILVTNTPEIPHSVSRKIKGDKRVEWKEAVHNLKLPPGLSVIIRTAAKSATFDDVKEDFQRLVRTWKTILKKKAEAKKPCCLREELDLVEKTIQDTSLEDIEAILVEGKNTLQKVKKILPKKNQDLCQPRTNLFYSSGLEKELKNVFQPLVRLPSGGTIVIQPTEAFIAVDVNSSRATQGKNAEETAITINTQAVDEVVRQVFLRNLSGLIVIDLIDVENLEHMADMEKRLKSLLKVDKARTSVGRIDGFGLLAFSRQRLGLSLQEVYSDRCQVCSGFGFTTKNGYVKNNLKT